MSSDSGTAPAATVDAGRRREQRAWYWYDWANSAYVTTTATVLFAPYLTSVAENAAGCGDLAEGEVCGNTLRILGIPVAAGSLALYAVTAATIISAIVLPIVGAVIDRTGRKRVLMGAFAWLGATAAASMYFVAGTNWQLGVALLMIANLSLGSSLVAYDAILVDIAGPDERDRVSSRGWALGYLGGGLLLAMNLALVTGHDALGLSTTEAVRISLLGAGVWWGVFTLVPFLGLRDRGPAAPREGRAPSSGSGLVRESFGQLASTLRHLRGYPQTLMFLLAYLLYNDGVQTVITSASIYGQKQLGLSESQLITTILVVQFVAMGGALLFGLIAARVGAWKAVLGSLVMWCVVVAVGYGLPRGEFLPFLALAMLIGTVLGGTQALSRSMFSQLIPRGYEAEYFSLYQATERGTSWFGTLLFGLVFQLTQSYRNAIIALIVFFVGGGLLLARVNIEQGIRDAGNSPPRVV